MSQPTNLIIENASGAAVRTDINNVIDALKSAHSGTARPAYAVAGTIWHNTTDGKWYLFNGSTDVAIVGATDTIEKAKTAENATIHMLDKNNPHAVTAAQVGLGNVNNTADTAKPVSTAQQTAINNAVSSAPVSAAQQTAINTAISNIPKPTVGITYRAIVESLVMSNTLQSSSIPSLPWFSWGAPAGGFIVGFRYHYTVAGNGYRSNYFYIRYRTIGVHVL